jgi:hypothetical protein
MAQQQEIRHVVENRISSFVNVIGERYVGSTTFLRELGDALGSRADLIRLKGMSDLESEFWQRIEQLQPTAATVADRRVLLIDDSQLLIEDAARRVQQIVAPVDRERELLRLKTRFANLTNLPDTAIVAESDGSLTDAYLEYLAPLQISRGSTPLSPFAGVYPVVLGLLTDSESDMLITDSWEKGKTRLGAPSDFGGPSQDDKDFLLREAGPHPRLLPIACDHLIRAKIRWGQTGPSTYTQARGTFYHDGTVKLICRALLEPRRPAGEQKALEMVLDSLPAANRDEPRLSHLVDRGLLILDAHGDYAPFSEVFRYWGQKPRRNELLRGAMNSPLLAPLQSQTQLATSVLAGITPYTFRPREGLLELGPHGRTMPLSPLDIAILDYLAEHEGQYVTRDQLKAELWQGRGTDSAVDKAVQRLRDKLEEDRSEPRIILRAHGKGVKLRPGAILRADDPA